MRLEHLLSGETAFHDCLYGSSVLFLVSVSCPLFPIFFGDGPCVFLFGFRFWVPGLQSHSSVGQSATLIMWRSAVQVCLGLHLGAKPMCPGNCFTPGTTLLSRFPGGLAQLARAPALQAGGQRFESVILHLILLWDICSLTY